MTEHKFTDEEIILAHRCCTDIGMGCLDCPFGNNENAEGCASLNRLVLDLINRQRAEIERLREKQAEDENLLNVRVMESVNAVSEAHRKYERALEECIKSTKAEAVKEFVEYLENNGLLNMTPQGIAELKNKYTERCTDNDTPRVVHKDYFTPEKSENNE